jgi:hypothetical protein
MSRNFLVRQDCPYEFLSSLENFIPDNDSVFRRHVKVAALGVFGCSNQEIAFRTKYTEQHVDNVLKEYNRKGFRALLDGRRNYNMQEVGIWFNRTANYLGIYLTSDIVRGWFSPATDFLNHATYPQQQLQPATVGYSQPNYSSPDSDSNFNWGGVFGFLFLMFIFGSCVNMVNHQNRNDSQQQYIPGQTYNQR